MKQTFNVGDKIKCVSPTGELIFGRIYTVKRYSPSSVYLEETSLPHYNYLPNRFELYTTKAHKDMTFDEQLTIAKGLVGKQVEYNHNKILVSDVLVFIKGVDSNEISQLVENVLKTKDWCIAIKSAMQTIPFEDITIPSYTVINDVGDYEAKVYTDHVMVGCQRISKAKVEEIWKAFQA